MLERTFQLRVKYEYKSNTDDNQQKKEFTKSFTNHSELITCTTYSLQSLQLKMELKQCCP